MSPEEEKLTAEFKRVFTSGDGQNVLRDLAQRVAIGVPPSLESDPTLIYAMEQRRWLVWYIYHRVFGERETPPKQSETPPGFDFSADPFRDMRRKA